MRYFANKCGWLQIFNGNNKVLAQHVGAQNCLLINSENIQCTFFCGAGMGPYSPLTLMF